MTQADILVEAIANWQAKKQSRNLGMLSRLSHVSYSTLRRLMTDKVEINQENAINIASIVFDDKQFRSFICEYVPAMKRFVSPNYPKQDEDDNGLSYFLSLKEFSRIIVFSSRTYGVTQADLCQKFGERVMAAVEILIDNGILLQDKMGIIRFEGDVGHVSISLARRALSHLVDEFHVPEGFTTPQTAWLGWENLTPDAVRTCNAILAKASQDLFEVIKKPENRGEILTFMGTVLNVIDGVEAFELQKEPDYIHGSK